MTALAQEVLKDPYGSVEPSQRIVDALISDTSAKAQFVPYKSQHSGDEGMALQITEPEKITQEEWSIISRLMSQKGYDSRGAADAQRAVYGFLQRNNSNVVPPIFQDWIDTIAIVLNLKAPSQSPKVKTVGATPASKVFRRAIKEWGTTDNPGLAGYILPSGAMLDLSGAKQGGGHMRAYDHRQVGQFFDEQFAEQTDAMHAFMDLGAIRWMPEQNGFDFRRSPTASQVRTVRTIMDQAPNETYRVDASDPRYGQDGAEYSGTMARHVCQFVQRFFQTGKLRKPEGVMRYHESAKRIVRTLLDDEQMNLPFDWPEDDTTDPTYTPDELDAMIADVGATNTYTQIDGDFGDAWLYGGTWYNSYRERTNKTDSLIHIDGLEGEGLSDYDTSDQRVEKEFNEPEWQAKYNLHIEMQKDAEEIGNDDAEEIERIQDVAKDEILTEIADALNAGRALRVYMTNVNDDPNEEYYVTNGLQSMLQSCGLDHEAWIKMDKAGQWVVVAQYYGWDNLDSYPTKMTKSQLSDRLGINL